VARAIRHARSTPLLAEVRAVNTARCQRLIISGDSPLKHPEFVPVATECRGLGIGSMALESDAAALARRGIATVLQRSASPN
jgi:hypothetical protein